MEELVSSMPPHPPVSPSDDFVSVPPQAAHNGLAIAALVLGILGLFACAPAGILAVVLGIIAFVRAQNQPPIHPGRALAIAGICCGGLGTIIGMSLLMLLPSLKAAREQGRRAVCLSNLSQLARASAAYAIEDSGDRLIPIHESMVCADAKHGWRGTPWWWRTAQPHVFGGRTAGRYPTSAGYMTVMQDEQGIWAASNRPLNRYLYGGTVQSVPLFHCPTDSGYPNAKWVDDCSREAMGLPCYDYLGNSYRIAVCGLTWTSGQDSIGFFSSGVLGHAQSDLDNPSVTVLYAEPTFEGFTRPEASADPDLKTTTGWHGRPQQDNVAYCDGSVRSTLADTNTDWPDAFLKEMNYTSAYPWTTFLRRGPTWQIDCYPAPGVQIPMKDASGADISPVPEKGGGWPFSGYQDLR
jgi:hypothetical protein